MGELSDGARRLAAERLQAPVRARRRRHPRPPQGGQPRLLPDRRRGRLRALRGGLRLRPAAAAQPERARQRCERVTVVDSADPRLRAGARAAGGGRPDRQAGPLGRRPRPRRRDRLGGPRRRARPLRAEGRERPLGGRLAGERLRVRPSTDAHPAELRRPLQLGADGRRPLAAAHHERRRLPHRRSLASSGFCARTPTSARSCHRTRAPASLPTDTPRS